MGKEARLQAEGEAAAATAIARPRDGVVHSGGLPKLLSVIIIVLLVLSLALRLRNIRSPLVEGFSFRQTQTAFTVWCYLQEGISLSDPKCPIFGPPWRVPFECPIYQASVALLIKGTGMDIDVGCRVTSILYFCFSCLALYKLVRLFAEARVAGWCLLIYVWSPLTFTWSRACLPEFSAVTFALGFVYFFVRWLRQPGQRWLPPLIVLAGSLGALSKITTMAMTVPVILLFLFQAIRERIPPRGQRGPAWMREFLAYNWRFLLTAAAVVLVPVIIGQGWIAHTDRIKAASGATAWLTSANIEFWNYGTVRQRFSMTVWGAIIDRITRDALPGVFSIAAIIALVAALRSERGPGLFLYGMAAGTLLPIGLFTNLYYIHTYYLAAVSPCLAVLAGFGIDYLYHALYRTDKRGGVVFLLLLALSLIPGRHNYIMSLWPGGNDPIYLVGIAAGQVTAPNECIMVTDHDWNPDILYYAKRRGYMMDFRCHYGELDTRSITTVVTPDENNPVLKMWPEHHTAAHVHDFFIIKVH